MSVPSRCTLALSSGHGVVVFGDLFFGEPVGLFVLEKEDRVWVSDSALEHPLGIGREARGDDFEAGRVAEPGLDALGVVERATGHDAVGDADGYGDVPVTVGAVVEPGGLVDDLVEGRRDEVGELDLRHRTHPVHGETDGSAHDQAFGQRRVHYPNRPELIL